MFGRAIIVYLHRGAPGDLMTISGSDIKELERSFFVTEDGRSHIIGSER